MEILRERRKLAGQIHLQEVFPFATASLRNITNTEEVRQAIQAGTGFSVRVLSGQEEATFDYYGAIQSAPPASGLLADVGGGSTELVQFRDRTVLCADSIAVGSLNLFHRFVESLRQPVRGTKDGGRDGRSAEKTSPGRGQMAGGPAVRRRWYRSGGAEAVQRPDRRVRRQHLL